LAASCESFNLAAMGDAAEDSMPSAEGVTALLQDWSAGDTEAEARVFSLVYNELRRLAASYLSQERSGHTLQPTALVHEAYLRLVDPRQQISWQNRAHFYGIAARIMRQILVQHARTRAAIKRGGLEQRVSLDEQEIAFEDTAAGLVALDGALEGLAHEYPRQSEVVVLKFFGGLEVREIAGMLQVSEKTILRDWNFARLWLYRELGATSGHG
jgi:RNA polymerase sigma factor (TIGR02999 family)